MSITAKLLHHHYKWTDDFFGENPCPVICVSCGCCDHFPPKYVIIGFKQIVRQINYHCKDPKCIKTVSELNNSDKKYNVDVINKSTKCKICWMNNIEDYTDENTYFTYYDRIVCSKCSTKNKLTEQTFEKKGDGNMSNKFKCPNCYSINDIEFVTDEKGKKVRFHCEKFDKVIKKKVRNSFVDSDIINRRIIEKKSVRKNRKNLMDDTIVSNVIDGAYLNRQMSKF
jgi:hypothetical protein